MRLTALRHPLKDISRPKHFRQPKPKPNSNDLYPQITKDCKSVYPKVDKSRSVGMRAAPYGGGVRAPCIPAHPNHLYAPAAFNTGSFKDHMLSDIKINKNLPTISLPANKLSSTETSHAGRPDNKMRKRDGAGISVSTRPLVGQQHTSPPHTQHLHRIRDQMETHHPGRRGSSKPIRIGGATVISLPTDNKLSPTETPRAGRHGSEMRLRRKRHLVRIREQVETHHLGRWKSGKPMIISGATECVCPPPL
jgi:hypothetical protein